jgi:hypothetical protein
MSCAFATRNGTYARGEMEASFIINDRPRRGDEGTSRGVVSLKIIAASDGWLNIDNDEEWCTYNYRSAEKAIVRKKTWPTYSIALTIYSHYFPLDPPIEIGSIEEIDEGIISQVQRYIAKYTSSY